MRKPPAILYGLNIKEIARICGVSLKTAQRWKSGQTVPPKTALQVLIRNLGCFHPGWHGWTINEAGQLVSPEGWQASPGDVLAIQFTQAQLSAWRLEAQRLKAELEAREAGFFEDQPTPESWEVIAS